MCISATTLLIASAAASAAGAVASGVQARQQGKYQQAQANADAAAQQGEGRVLAERIRRAGAQQRAEAQAAFARSGVSIDNGTPLEINRRIAEDYERDALTATFDREGAAAQLRARGEGARIAGQNAMGNALLSAAGTALRGWGMASADSAARARMDARRPATLYGYASEELY